LLEGGNKLGGIHGHFNEGNPNKSEIEWQDYTCFWLELTKLSNPDRMGQISKKEETMKSIINTQNIFLSPAAADVVRSLRQQQNLDDSFALRVYITGQTCSGFQYGMALDNKPRETDYIFESEELKIFVDETSIQNMDGASVDYIDDQRGKGFLVINPNSASSCSCESGTCGTNEH
jgi:iron-sulfur cluster insertion protein